MQNLPPEIVDIIFSYTDPETCIKNEQFHILKKKFPYVTLNWAIKSGKLEVVKYFRETLHADYTYHAIDYAISAGHLEIIKYLYTEDPSKFNCSENAIDWAASNGQLQLVRYLNEVVDLDCTHTAIDWAAENGHFEVVKYIWEKTYRICSEDAIDYAAKNGHFDIVKYLYEAEMDYTIRAADWAIEFGHLDIVKYLCRPGNCGYTDDAVKAAQTNGHHKVVEYLHTIEALHPPCSLESF